MASFVLSFFPLNVLDEIWDLVESVAYLLLSSGINLSKAIYRIQRLWKIKLWFKK